MSTEQSPNGGAESAELARESRSLMATPKSTVWQLLLNVPATLGLGLVGVLGTNLLTDSFKENPLVQFVVGGIGWVALVLFVVGLSARAYLFVRDHVALPEAQPELPEPGGPWEAAPAPEERNDLADNWAAAVLRDMPLRTYELPVLLDVLSASAGARMPVTNVSMPDDDMPSAPALLEQLVTDDVLRRSTGSRYLLAAVPPEDRHPATGTPEWRAALAMLLRRHAEQATRWARALDAPATAARARAWFTNEEPRLCDLLSNCAELEGLDQVRAVASDLGAIADALDTWFVRCGKAEDFPGRDREGRQRDRSSPAAAMVKIGKRTKSGLVEALAAIRADSAEQRSVRYSPRPLSRSLRARALHRQALKTLGPRETQREDTINLLEQAWWLLPREDVAGEVCALANMAIVHLMQGRYTAARDRLELADSMAADGRDPVGAAHVHEIAGALDWASGELRHAVGRWQLALAEWRALADDLGTGRCLQHLGSAVVAEPTLAATLMDADHIDGRPLHQAAGWLVKAKELNPGLTADTCENELLGKLSRENGSPVNTLPEFDRWPLPPPDQAATSD
ncbi:hypothetical protein VMT65_08405 [Nocardia sp. CDC153]|uniref:hypothetical protein n=1 Tax=Nocardia sp. CDC153 TaxID=3112167 RepID=UPI002DB68001|nr:hypothetical protein [Nocardia sp. CDC153]MEC3953047.1 hypothetical protein [Nocardia sp. CDC153]